MSTTSKTRQEIAAEYGISVRTLSRWIKKHQLPITRHRMLVPKEIKLIYKAFGLPSKLEQSLSETG